MRASLLATMVLALPLAGQGVRPPPAAMADAVREVEAIDAMRSGLAASLPGGPTPGRQVFAQVCKPVGARARQLAEERGWQVIQMAERHRNPSHGLDADGEFATRFFTRHPQALAVWLRSSQEGREGTRYFRRITVERACLACHGAEESRPAFIAQDYPGDRAFGFREGDLRGVYAVFIPDSGAGRPAGPGSR